MSTRAQSIALTIHHVRNRRQRMPVSPVAVGEGPLHSGEGNAARYRRILIDVGTVVVIDKIVTECLAKNQPRDHRQEKADDGH